MCNYVAYNRFYKLCFLHLSLSEAMTKKGNQLLPRVTPTLVMPLKLRAVQRSIKMQNATAPKPHRRV